MSLVITCDKCHGLISNPTPMHIDYVNKGLECGCGGNQLVVEKTNYYRDKYIREYDLESWRLYFTSKKRYRIKTILRTIHKQVVLTAENCGYEDSRVMMLMYIASALNDYDLAGKKSYKLTAIINNIRREIDKVIEEEGMDSPYIDTLMFFGAYIYQYL